MNRFPFVLILSTIGLLACTPQVQHKVEVVPEIATEMPYKKLQGKWLDSSGEYVFYEIWAEKNEEMQGTGVVLSNADTVFIEHLGILLKDSIWHYSARIDKENNGEPVYFSSTITDENVWVFENPEHDFPQKIEYQFKGADSLLITISGQQNDSLKVEYFRLKKKKCKVQSHFFK